MLGTEEHGPDDVPTGAELPPGTVLAVRRAKPAGAWRREGARPHEWRWWIWVVVRTTCARWSRRGAKGLHEAAAEAASLLERTPEERVEAAIASEAAQRDAWGAEAGVEDGGSGRAAMAAALHEEGEARVRRLEADRDGTPGTNGMALGIWVQGRERRVEHRVAGATAVEVWRCRRWREGVRIGADGPGTVYATTRDRSGRVRGQGLATAHRSFRARLRDGWTLWASRT